MSTDVASTWTVLGNAFAQPGLPITDRSTTTDLGEVAKLLHRLKIQGRVLAYGTFGWTSNALRNARASNETGQTTFRTAGRGDFWWRGDRIRYRLHAYCQQVDVKVTIDGASTTTLSGSSTLNWVTSSTITYTSLTPGADGEVDITIEVKQNNTTGSRLWYAFVLEAVDDTAYGDGDDYTGAFQQMDSESWNADSPVTGWHLSTIERNVRDIQRSKPRGVCHCYLEANATNTTDAVTHDRCLIASVFPKCDGPYLVWAPPWATEIDVFVRCASAVSGLTSTVSVLTDQDAPSLREAILDTGERAQSFLNTSPSLLKWTVPITAARSKWTAVRVWIVHHSEIGSQTDTYFVEDINTSGPPVIYLTAPEPGLPYDGPFGLCLGQDEAVADATLKGTTYILGITNLVDFSAGIDTGSGASGYDARLYASPHPAKLELISALGEDLATSEAVKQYSMAMLRVYGVYAGARSGEAAFSTTETRAAAQVGAIPSGSRLQRSVAAINELVLFSTPQIASRTPGQRWLYGESSFRIGATPWTFIQCGHSTWLEVATWPVPYDMALGGDVDVNELEAVFFVAAFASKNGGDNPTLDISARLVCDGVTGDTFTFRIPQRPANDPDLRRGEWDASIAARLQTTDRAGGGIEYNHAYTQHTEWFAERMSQTADWYSKSATVRVAAPTTLPAECRLEVLADVDTDPILAILGGGLQAARRA